ncbi:MAG: hypothetical protein ACLFTE_03460 [Salinivenus sp.]
MNAILPIAIYAALGLAGLGLLGMSISGLRSLAYGKIKPLSIVVVALPGILVLILGFSMQNWTQAGIYTIAALFGVTLLGMFLSGVRSIFR